MIDLKIFLDFDLFFKLLKYVFIPLIIFVIFLGIVLKIYCSKRKKKDREKYIRRSNIISLLFASLITFILLLVNILFSLNFTNEISINNLISGNEIIYYGVLISPIIPLLCFVFYLISLLKVIFVDKSHEEKAMVGNQQISSNEEKKKEEVNVNKDGIEIL